MFARRDIAVSIVIPTLGRRRILEDCLKDIKNLASDSWEVIVIDQGEPSFSGDFGMGSERLRIFHCPIPSASLARNIGLREALGAVVLFLDDDVRIPNPYFLESHLRHFRDPSVSGVYGQVLEVNQMPTCSPEPEQIETDWGWMKLPANYGRRCRTRNGASNNLSVRRDWALLIGGMDAWFERGARREETEFNLRYTKRFGLLMFDPEASLIHLSADGGSRSWGRVQRIVPMHHIVGHWYFLLRAIYDRTLSLPGIFLEIRYIATALLKNPQVGINPLIFFQNFFRTLAGFLIALSRVLRGARRISFLNSKMYSEISVESISA